MRPLSAFHPLRTLTGRCSRSILMSMPSVQFVRGVMAVCLAAMSLAAIAHAGQSSPAPLPESTEASIEYPSVDAALKALHARPGVVFATENGWAIATDEAAYTIWSFAPPGYPAYPAMVKRKVVQNGTGSAMVMSVHCEASKTACDDLVRTFSRLNGLDLPK